MVASCRSAPPISSCRPADQSRPAGRRFRCGTGPGAGTGTGEARALCAARFRCRHRGKAGRKITGAAPAASGRPQAMPAWLRRARNSIFACKGRGLAPACGGLAARARRRGLDDLVGGGGDRGQRFHKARAIGGGQGFEHFLLGAVGRAACAAQGLAPARRDRERIGALIFFGALAREQTFSSMRRTISASVERSIPVNSTSAVWLAPS